MCFVLLARFEGAIQRWWQGVCVFLAALDAMMTTIDPRASFQIEEKWKERRREKRAEVQSVLSKRFIR